MKQTRKPPPPHSSSQKPPSSSSPPKKGASPKPPWQKTHAPKQQPRGPRPTSSAPRTPFAAPRGQGSGLEPELHVVGRHPVAAVLEHQPSRAKKLWLQKASTALELEEAAKRAGVPVVLADVDVLDGLAGRGAVHQGAVLSCGPYPYVDLEDLAEVPSLTLVLDGVEDPRNLGAAARAALALGATLVVVPRDRAASCTASAHKAAAGALSQIRVAQVNNLKRGLELLKQKGAWLVGAEADGTQMPWDVDLTTPIALVVGGEDRGLRRLTREACDHVVAIPMATTGTSLNAADAATVLLYEAMRQRALKKT